MALPFSRNTTYAPGIDVKSVDLNDLQDQIIALHARVIPVGAREGPLSNGFFVLGYWEANGVEDHILPLPLIVGDVLASISVTLQWDGGPDIEHSVYVQKDDGSFVTIGATWVDASVSPGAGGTVELQILNGNDYTVLPGDKLYYRFIAGRVGDQLHKLAVSVL